MNIDVVIPTKNRLEPCLPECLESMAREIPINRLIVIDGYSDDGTVECIRKFCEEREIGLELIQTEAPLSKARQKGIEKVNTEWFLFLDSDVILKENYFDKLKEHIGEEEVGAVQGRKQQTLEESSEEYCPEDQEWIRRRSYRGGTHATLIRKEAVEGIKIPKDLRTWEDEYIRRYIEGDLDQSDKDYKWVFEPNAIFHPDQSDSFEKTEYEGRIFARYDFKPAYRVIGRALKTRRKEDVKAAKGYLKEVLNIDR